ncbi:antibiotic biosynthesis monooxygenase [Verrucomicrobium spinosum]|uniref:antibiotic biosynthesis monooxygenase n=1 Tax=Verrucomicrobium spinosum TaxID=2736 RepID=UPI0031B61EC3
MDDAVHVAITRRVRPEHVGAFEKALTEFARDSLHAPGTRGVQFLYPAPGSGPTSTASCAPSPVRRPGRRFTRHPFISTGRRA